MAWSRSDVGRFAREILALTGFGRVYFAAGPTFANGDEATHGLAVVESKLHVSTTERADFIGAKASVRDEREAAAMRLAGSSKQNADLLVGWNFKNALANGLEPRQIR